MKSYHRWSKVGEHRQAPGIAESLVGASDLRAAVLSCLSCATSKTRALCFWLLPQQHFQGMTGLMSNRGRRMLRVFATTMAAERDERWLAPRSHFSLAMATVAVLLSVLAMSCKKPSAPSMPAGPPIPSVTVATVVAEGCADLRPVSWYYGWIRQRSTYCRKYPAICLGRITRTGRGSVLASFCSRSTLGNTRLRSIRRSANSPGPRLN